MAKKEDKIKKLKDIGKEIDFDFQITGQAQTVISHIDNFPIDHFKQWWKKNFGVVNGQQLYKYFCVEDGIIETKRK